MNKDSWDSAEKWYDNCVVEKGHYYHQAVIFPNLLKLLDLEKGGSLLDLGCGQGVLARNLPEKVSYWGVDNSKLLIEQAKKSTQRSSCHFSVADASTDLQIEKKDFDWACFILSLQKEQVEQYNELAML